MRAPSLLAIFALLCAAAGYLPVLTLNVRDPLRWIVLCLVALANLVLSLTALFRARNRKLGGWTIGLAAVLLTLGAFGLGVVEAVKATMNQLPPT